TYDCARPLIPWVMAIARFRVHDYWRRHYSRGGLENIDIEDMKNILCEDRTQKLESGEDIKRALMSLPPKQREILDLMYKEDKSIGEVAAQMKMSVSAVKVAAHRGYKTFRKRFME